MIVNETEKKERKKKERKKEIQVEETKAGKETKNI